MGDGRRIEGGDWVVLASSVTALPGLGKVVDGTYAPEDDALTEARVELTHGTHWLAPADLTRVTPEEEAWLCRRALERLDLPPERTRRLRTALEAFAAGTAPYARSPGLLDKLWGLLPAGPREAGSRRTGPAGLVRFFDAGRQLLAERERLEAERRAAAFLARAGDEPEVLPAERVRPGRGRRRREAAPGDVAPGDAAPWARAERDPTPRPGPEPVAGRVQARRDVLSALLRPMNRNVLERLAAAVGVRSLWCSAQEVREALVRADPPLDAVLSRLTPNQLRGAAAALGLSACAAEHGESLRARIRACAPPAVAPAAVPPAAPGAAAPAPASGAPGPPARTRAEVLALVLRTMNRSVLKDLAAAHELWRGAHWRTSQDVREALVRLDAFDAVLGTLSVRQLRGAAVALGLGACGDADAVALRERIRSCVASLPTAPPAGPPAQPPAGAPPPGTQPPDPGAAPPPPAEELLDALDDDATADDW